MKMFDGKSLVLGLLIGIIGFSTVLEVWSDPLFGTIKSATFTNSKVYFYGKEIPLENPLVTIVRDENSERELYMPMRELLEYMQFNVEWNNENSSVNLMMNDYNSYDNYTDSIITSDISENEADKKAIEIIQKTGNWKYVEPYLIYMSSDAIQKVIEIYNSKHINVSEHKNASDYMKKDDKNSENKVVINLKNQNINNIVESGSFQAEDKQILTLSIISDMKGGSVDLFLFNPKGEEKRIIINSEKSTKEIELMQGLWKYNCTGMFKDGSNVRIIGTISN